MKLNENQENLIANLFFEHREYPGWRAIAQNLLLNGKCIVAGNKNIWIGGIGNFITVTNTEDAVGCVLYNFNLDSFLSSEYFKDVMKSTLIDLNTRKRNIEKEIIDIKELL